MKTLFITVFCLCSFSFLSAQHFKSNIVVGFQLSDIDGSMSAKGYNLGIKGLYQLSPKWSLSTGILMTQNGDYFEYFPKGSNYETLRLNFVEIPIQANFAYGKSKKQDFYPIRFYGGATYAHLFQQKIVLKDQGNISKQIDLSENAILPHFGVIGFLTPRLGFDFKSTLVVHGEWTLALRSVFVL